MTCLTKLPQSQVKRGSRGSREAPRHPPQDLVPACLCPPCCWKGRWRLWSQSGTKAQTCCSPSTLLMDHSWFGMWSTWMNSTRASSDRFRWAETHQHEKQHILLIILTSKRETFCHISNSYTYTHSLTFTKTGSLHKCKVTQHFHSFM